MQSKREFLEEFRNFAVMAAEDGKVSVDNVSGSDIPDFMQDALEDGQEVAVTSFKDRKSNVNFTLYLADDGWIVLSMKCGKECLVLFEEDIYLLSVMLTEPNEDGTGRDPRCGIVVFDFLAEKPIYHKLVNAGINKTMIEHANLSCGQFVTMTLVY